MIWNNLNHKNSFDKMIIKEEKAAFSRQDSWWTSIVHLASWTTYSLKKKGIHRTSKYVVPNINEYQP